MTQTPLEDRLRAALAAKADSASAPVALGPAVIARATRVHRRHVLAAAASAAALALVLVAALLVGLLSRPAAPPAHRSTPSPAPTGFADAGEYADWINGLNRGPDVTGPIPYGGDVYWLPGYVHLVQPGAATKTVTSYVGRRGDVLLLLEAPSAARPSTRLMKVRALTSASGEPHYEVTVLADHVSGAAMSPGSDRVAVGSAGAGEVTVLDAAAGREVARRADTRLVGGEVVGWSGASVVVAVGSGGGSRLLEWAPGGALVDAGVLPTVNPAQVEAVAGDPGRVLVSRAGDHRASCASVLALDDLAHPLVDGCYGAAPVSLAPDGRHALRSDLSGIDVATNRVVSSGAPRGVAVHGELAWEDASSVVTGVQARVDRYLDPMTARLRCDVARGGCERTGISSEGGGDIEVPLP